MAPLLAGIGKAIIFDALPSIIAAIPRLGSIFTGPNSSEVAKRNVQAVSVIAETIGAAVGANNAQATVEALKDPAKLQQARDADGTDHVVQRAAAHRVPGVRTLVSGATGLLQGIGLLPALDVQTATQSPLEAHTRYTLLPEAGLREAENGGEFVCTAAGHHLEAMLAAYGSGAARVSHDQGKRILNVDIGGGTTDIAVLLKTDFPKEMQTWLWLAFFASFAVKMRRLPKGFSRFAFSFRASSASSSREYFPSLLASSLSNRGLRMLVIRPFTSARWILLSRLSSSMPIRRPLRMN